MPCRQGTSRASARWGDERGLISETGPHRRSAPHRTSSRRVCVERGLVSLALADAPHVAVEHPAVDLTETWSMTAPESANTVPRFVLRCTSSASSRRGGVPKTDTSARCAPRPRRAPRDRPRCADLRARPEANTASQRVTTAARRRRVRRVFSPKGVDSPVTPHVTMGRPAAGPASTLLVLAPLAQTRRLRVTQPQLVTELSSNALPKEMRSRSRHPVSPRDACSEKPNPCHNSAVIDDRATVPVTPR